VCVFKKECVCERERGTETYVYIERGVVRERVRDGGEG